MQRLIIKLKEDRCRAEGTFIYNSLVVYKGRKDDPIPELHDDLMMIDELNQAISVLESYYANKGVE